MLKQFYFKQFSLANKTVLFQTIHLSISTQFCSIWPMEMTLSGATTLGQSGPGSDGNVEVFHIPQNSSITGTTPSYYLVSYPGHSLVVGVLIICREVVGIFYSPNRLAKYDFEVPWLCLSRLPPIPIIHRSW